MQRTQTVQQATTFTACDNMQPRTVSGQHHRTRRSRSSVMVSLAVVRSTVTSVSSPSSAKGRSGTAPATQLGVSISCVRHLKPERS